MMRRRNLLRPIADLRRQRGFIINPYVFSGGGGGGGDSDPDFASVISLLHFEGSDASTTFTDQIGGMSWTRAGDAQIDTAQFKYGAASGLFDGTGDYIGAGNVTGAQFAGAGAAGTVEFWFRKNATNLMWLVGQRASATGFGWNIMVNASGGLDVNGTGSFMSTANSLVSSGTWYHVALDINGNTKTLYLDGVSRATSSITITSETTAPLRIGTASDGVTFHYYNGHIDDSRITTVRRYTTAFTPPTTQFPDS